MTYRDFEVGSGTTCRERRRFRNFTWTTEATADWEIVWSALWRFGIKWEWQNSDRYARRYGDTYNFYACHNDAVRLDMALPLPGQSAILDINEYLSDEAASGGYGHPGDLNRDRDACRVLLEKWIENYV